MVNAPKWRTSEREKDLTMNSYLVFAHISVWKYKENLQV
jgi:hypothetical protein